MKSGKRVFGASVLLLTILAVFTMAAYAAAAVGSYRYVHEYYLQNPDGTLTLEGTSEIGSSEGVSLVEERQYTQADVSKEPEFQGRTYTYDGAAYGIVLSETDYFADEIMRSAIATESGEQIIILRYVRSSASAALLPDPNDPESPEKTTVWEDDALRDYVKVWDSGEEKFVYVPDDSAPDVPAVPETGEEYDLILWVGVAAVSAAGAGALILTQKKEKERGR